MSWSGFGKGRGRGQGQSSKDRRMDEPVPKKPSISPLESRLGNLKLGKTNFIRFLLHLEDNSKITIQVKEDALIQDVLTTQFPGREDNITIAAYDQVYTSQQKLSEILQNNPSNTLLATSKDSQKPTIRDLAAANTDLVIQRKTTEIMANQWDKYHHHSAGYFAWTAYTSSQPNKPGVLPPTFKQVEARVNDLRMNPQRMTDYEIQTFFKWDVSGGDCTASHVRIKALLETDPDTKGVKWNLRCAQNVHTCLTGYSVTGALFVVDVGGLKSCFCFKGGDPLDVVAVAGRRVAAEVLTRFRVVWYQDGTGATVLYQPKKGRFVKMEECTVRECFNQVTEKMAIQKEYALLIRASWPNYTGIHLTLRPHRRELEIMQNSEGSEKKRVIDTYTFGDEEFEKGRREMMKIIENAEMRRTKSGDIKLSFTSWRMLMKVLISDWTWQT